MQEPISYMESQSNKNQAHDSQMHTNLNTYIQKQPQDEKI